jgi:thiol-disulfide isomerase/thioredoxin
VAALLDRPLEFPMTPISTQRWSSPLAALLCGAAVLGLSASCHAAEEKSSRGVTAQTHGAGEMFQGASTGEPIPPAKPLDGQVIRDLTLMTADSGQALEGVRKVRGYLTQDLAPEYQAYLRRLLVRGLILLGAPSAEIAAEADIAAPGIPQAGSVRSLFYIEVAQVLLARGEAPAVAARFASEAIANIPPDETRGEVRAFANGLLGRAHLAAGECQPAIETLTRSVGAAPDSQSVLYSLGAAYEQCGKPEYAITHYVRALGVYGGRDSAAAAPLRKLYAAKHGSLAGLDAMIEKSYRASLDLEVFDSRRYEVPMPEWRMEDTAGHLVRSQDLAGKIVVLDFWGSWCGPCRMELPHFQAIYEKYRGEGVIFYGVNWERVDRAQRKAVASTYMEQNGFDFPNVYDLDDRAALLFKVASFPTVFIADPSGKIRYRNIGFSEGISDILTLQIESLIEEQKKAGAAKR